MKRLATVVVGLGVLAGLSAGTAVAGDHPFLGCAHCKLAHAHKFLSGLAGGCACHHGPIMNGNCAFGPCGKRPAPGPWYTYWPYNRTNLSSPYQTPGWTYLSHFQTPAPLGGGYWHTPDVHQPGFHGVPYYWQGH